MVVKTIAILLLAAACAPPAQIAPEDARRLIEDGWYSRAEAAARTQLDQAVKAHGERSIEAAEALSVLAGAMRYGEQAAKPGTIALAERAVEIERELSPRDDPRLATALFTLGLFHFDGAEYAQARPLLEEALMLRRSSLGEGSPEVARVLIVLANLSFNESWDLERALAVIAQAKEIQDKALPPDHKDVGWRLSRAGVFCFNAGELKQSRTNYEQALAIQRTALRPGHPELAKTLYNLSITLQALGEYASARKCCEEALEMRKLALGPGHYLLASNMRELAEIHGSMGQWDEAQSLLEQALAIEEQSFGKDSSAAIEFARQLASAALSNGRIDRARELLERCHAYYQAHPVQGVQLMPMVLQELGYLQMVTGDLDAAKATLADAQAAGELAYGVNDPSLASILQTRAEVLLRSGASETARDLLERAARIQETASGSGSPEFALILEALARARRSLGEQGPALEDALRAETIARTHLAETARGFEQEPLLSYASTRTSGLDLAVELAADSAKPETAALALDAVIRSRTLVLDLSIDRVRSIRASGDPRVAALRAEFETAAGRLSNLLVLGSNQGSPEQQREQVEMARKAKADAEARLAEASAGFRRDRARSTAGLSEVSAALPPQSALVSYSRARDNAGWFAFVLHAGCAQPVLLKLGEADMIDSLISISLDKARRRAPEAEYRAAGARLREQVWDPVAAQLGEAQRVFLVPDGSLAFVDFASLPAASPGTELRYLIETAPLLHELTAERDLVSRTEQEAVGEGLLALGGPDFDLSRDAASSPTSAGHARGLLEGMQFDRLPESAHEAEAIAALWPTGEHDPAVTLLTGGAATEAAFKKLAPHRAVLHVATHAFFAEGHAGPSGTDRTRGLPLGLSAPAPATAPPKYQERTVVLAGLALAGANRRERAAGDEDDGVLTSEEVACMDLSGTSWAVLSACDTGLGVSHSAEGVLGLRRAFLIAGARTVISSLWAVDDDLAREWMVALYRARLERKLGTAEAMRAVGLEMLQRRREQKQNTEPYTWAGFVAVGDWR